MDTGAASPRRPGRPGADTPAVPEGGSILQRGLEAFAELGYDHASARELARRLGVSHNFINDRYGSKAAFWRAVLDHALGTDLEPLPWTEEAVDEAERLRRAIAGFYRGAVHTPLVGRIFVDEFSQDTERLDYLYERYIGPMVQGMLPCVERLVASGRMAPIPMHVLFFAVVPPVSGMVDGPLAQRLGRSEPATPEQLAFMADRLAELVVNGLLATGSHVPA
ncbi:TetR/AcrR family transcriptional regulator [Streptomyces sp. NPDC046909]|uniref:TetR/AcrR family transcriptional regulator n=1 Tax=Streptomyces sp. NPDC046909 TaxID=3155617 RepID=UPI0033C71153